MIKYLAFAIICSPALAGDWIICAVRQSDGAAQWHCDSVGPTTTETAPIGYSWQAFRKGEWRATAAELRDGVHVLEVAGARVVNRSASVVAAERAMKAMALAKVNAVATIAAARQRADTLASEVKDDPQSSDLQAALAQAQSELTAARAALKAIK